MNSNDVYYEYKKERHKFSIRTYILLFVWMILGLIQWLIAVSIKDIQNIFTTNYYICFGTFMTAVFLFSIMLLQEKLRYNKVISPLLTVIIVELQIISLFALVVRSQLLEVLVHYIICIVLVVLFTCIGVFLPKKMDLTLHIALLFILGFLFLLIAIYFLMLHILVTEFRDDTSNYSFLLVEIPLTITMLFFVTYHAQTIAGGRFAEMRLHDFYLASLILFHDFLLIYLLTFFCQITTGLVSSKQLNYPMWSQEMTIPDTINGVTPLWKFRPTKKVNQGITLDLFNYEREGDPGDINLNDLPEVWEAQELRQFP